jgi:hypothetical protein
MTYALREARHTAPGALPAQIAAHASRNALCAQSARIPGPRPGPRPGQPPVTECYWPPHAPIHRCRITGSAPGLPVPRGVGESDYSSCTRRAGPATCLVWGDDADMPVVTSMIARPERHALILPQNCEGGRCAPTWARRSRTLGRFSEPVTLLAALEPSFALRWGTRGARRIILSVRIGSIC